MTKIALSNTSNKAYIIPPVYDDLQTSFNHKEIMSLFQPKFEYRMLNPNTNLTRKYFGNNVTVETRSTFRMAVDSEKNNFPKFKYLNFV